MSRDVRDAPSADAVWCEHCGWCATHACTVIVMSDDEEAEALAELETASGADSAMLIYPKGTPGADTSWYCGIFHWVTPNGWQLRIYNDCGEWDYVQTLTAPDGREWSFPFDPANNSALTARMANWAPTDESGWPGVEHCAPWL